MNHVGLLESGEDALLARLHLIEQAKRSIDIQTFIWVNDECGQLMARALIEAAKRGVKVRVLVDYVGLAKDAGAMAWVTRAHPNLKVRVYRPTAKTLEGGYLESLWYVLTNFKGANQRMHNKVFVVDDAVAITGGRNVENSYFSHALGMNFKDRDALIVGPVAQKMTQSFDSFWIYRHTIAAEKLRDVASATPDAENTLTTPLGKRVTAVLRRARSAQTVRDALVRPLRLAQSVTFFSDLPGKNAAFLLKGGGRATTHIIRALGEAEREIWIQSPYLVLGGSDLRYFRNLRSARPEIQVTVSTNSFASTDNLIAYTGNVRLRDRYVHQLGMDIGEYRPLPQDLRRVLPKRESKERSPFVCIHAKSFVVDDDLAFVGSFNLDPRSAHLNTEAGVLIRDPIIAKALKNEIRQDLKPENSWAIAPREALGSLINLQMLTREVTDLSPIDVAPLDATSAFELKPGANPVPRDHPEFYQRYRDIGSFPGSDGILTERELKGRLLKLSTPIIDPLL
ncbi:MAG: phospholipase D-like domain-containing protein [Verrucomicrobiales bacterium]